MSQKLERELAYYDHGTWNNTNIVEVASLFSGLIVIEIARTNLGDRFKWNASLYSANVCQLDKRELIAEFGEMTAEDAVISVDSLEQEVAVDTAAEWAYNALKNNFNIIGWGCRK
ncbi:hypothetical protein HELA111659_06360 [Helicobacter labetoulli]